jgi:uncharacterized protein YbjT (DUF2867 family)
MDIAIFGATGSIGRLLVGQAVLDGHRVTAFARSVLPSADGDSRIRPIRGDILVPDDVERAVRGQDAVLCAVGAGLRGGVRAQGTANIVAAMQRHGVSRLICQTTLGVGESWSNLNAWWKYAMFGLLLRAAFRDHVRQEAIVRASGLDWTIVRPSAFTDRAAEGPLRHGFSADERGLALVVLRAEVARFMLDRLADAESRHRVLALSC